MFSWCHAPCFHFPRVVFSGFVFHALILYVSCSVSHFIFSLLMFSFFSVRVACFQLSWFSFHFLFIVFYFHVFNFLKIASRVTKWPPGAPKSPQHDLPELQNGPKLSPEAPGWNCTPVRISLPGASRRQKLIFNDTMQRFERPWAPVGTLQPPAPGPRGDYT